MLSDNDELSIKSDSSFTTMEFYNLFNDLTSNEFNDILLFIEDLFNEYIDNFSYNMKNCKFNDLCIDSICNEIYLIWSEFNLCNYTNYDDIYSLVESYCYNLFIKFNIPSYVNTRDYQIYSDFNKIHNTIHYLKHIPQPIQRTNEWYNFRFNILSASNIWKIFKSETTRNSLIYEKCNPECINKNISSPSLEWGNKYESVSTMIYCDKYNTKIGEFGCIRHNSYDYIGASPDGINIDDTNDLFGRMLEIKNVVNRNITGIPKEDYWIQMQIQMETCNLDTCDFLETKFNEYTEHEFYNDSIHYYKGVILHFSKMPENNSADNDINKPHFEYYPINKCLDYEDIHRWIFNKKKELESTHILYTTLYWYLQEFSCVLVKRNSLWFNSVIDSIKNTWSTILYERKNGYEHRTPKKKVTITVDNNNTHTIHNLPENNNLKIIKK
jgi:putative phage-type endonuclease